MHSLDDASYVLRLDPKDMYGLTCAFPEQCARAQAIAAAVSLPTGGTKPSLVILTGLGGSAAGGDFTKALFDAESTVPFLVNRDYHLPAYVGKDTLVFATSYSGNTEETLSAYADAKKAGAQIICVTSGGKLAEMARADGYPVIQIPGGQPPRTALGFMLVPVIVACGQLGLIPEQDWDKVVAFLKGCVSLWSVDAPSDTNLTKQLALSLQGKLSVIYGAGGWQAIVANRWKGQINENSKNMTFANAFPELNHNEILGWVRAHEQGVEHWVAIVLEDGTESAKIKKRIEVTENLIKDVAETFHVLAPGSTLLEKMLGLALYGDYVSLYLAALNGVDPENIDGINILKAELSQVS